MQIELQWGVVQLMGHKIVAGALSKSEMFGSPLLRVDVPATDLYPAFTEFYNGNAIYGITFVSEEVARRTAAEVNHSPIKVYVPDLIPKEAHEQEVERLRDQLRRLRALPVQESDNWEEDDDAF